MLKMAQVVPADKVYDLGAGDGKIAIAAGKLFGATAVGVEYDADLVKHAQCLAEAEGVQARVTFVQGDIFETDFSDATVVALYLTTTVNLRLRPTLLDMKPGTRVVTYSFTMGDWRWDHHIDTDEGSAYLWIVPANAAGAWRFRSASGEGSFDIELEQTFQNLRGTTDGVPVTGTLSGDKIDFAFGQGGQPTQVAGVVDGHRITATVTRGGVSTEYAGTRP
jgi:SAM-dependent methyltransferase